LPNFKADQDFFNLIRELVTVHKKLKRDVSKTKGSNAPDAPSDDEHSARFDEELRQRQQYLIAKVEEENARILTIKRLISMQR
jgi:hypothetical protein